MNLNDMSFKESREAEMIIVPEIEKIMSDKETKSVFDDLFSPGTGKKESIKRGNASRKLVSRLVQCHFESICIIIAAMNLMKQSDVEKQKRSEVNKQIAELLSDENLISFFMSPEALDMAMRSVTSQK